MFPGNGAARQTRTADLILTKDALYHLSHSSMPLSNAIYINIYFLNLQVFFYFYLNKFKETLS